MIYYILCIMNRSSKLKFLQRVVIWETHLNQSAIIKPNVTARRANIVSILTIATAFVLLLILQVDQAAIIQRWYRSPFGIRETLAPLLSECNPPQSTIFVPKWHRTNAVPTQLALEALGRPGGPWSYLWQSRYVPNAYLCGQPRRRTCKCKYCEGHPLRI
jgi:hypothetical protein